MSYSNCDEKPYGYPLIFTITQSPTVEGTQSSVKKINIEINGVKMKISLHYVTMNYNLLKYLIIVI